MSAVFPVNEDPRWRIHDASPGQTVFAIPYAFQDATDITVVKIAPDGARMELSQPADYTVTGAGNPSGGSYTLAVPAQAGEKYLNFGDAEMARTSSVVRMGKFSSVAIDEDLDRALIRDLELRRDVGRSLKMDIGEGGLTVEPVPEGHFWKAGADGRMVDGGSAADIAAAQGYAVEAKEARDEAQSAQQAAEAAAAAAEDARDVALGAVPNVFSPTRTALKALDTATTTAAYLTEEGREGQFIWDGSDISDKISISMGTVTSDEADDTIGLDNHCVFLGQVVFVKEDVAGLTAYAPYYVWRDATVASNSSFKLALSREDAISGVTVDLTSSESFTLYKLIDYLEGMVVIPSGRRLDGSQGAFVRETDGNIFHLSWWGVLPGQTTESAEAINQAIHYVSHNGGGVLWNSLSGDYLIGDKTTLGRCIYPRSDVTFRHVPGVRYINRATSMETHDPAPWAYGDTGASQYHTATHYRGFWCIDGKAAADGKPAGLAVREDPKGRNYLDNFHFLDMPAVDSEWTGPGTGGGASLFVIFGDIRRVTLDPDVKNVVSLGTIADNTMRPCCRYEDLWIRGRWISCEEGVVPAPAGDIMNLFPAMVDETGPEPVPSSKNLILGPLDMDVSGGWITGATRTNQANVCIKASNVQGIRQAGPIKLRGGRTGALDLGNGSRDIKLDVSVYDAELGVYFSGWGTQYISIPKSKNVEFNIKYYAPSIGDGAKAFVASQSADNLKVHLQSHGGSVQFIESNLRAFKVSGFSGEVKLGDVLTTNTGFIATIYGYGPHHFSTIIKAGGGGAGEINPAGLTPGATFTTNRGASGTITEVFDLNSWEGVEVTGFIRNGNFRHVNPEAMLASTCRAWKVDLVIDNSDYPESTTIGHCTAGAPNWPCEGMDYKLKFLTPSNSPIYNYTNNSTFDIYSDNKGVTVGSSSLFNEFGSDNTVSLNIGADGPRNVYYYTNQTSGSGLKVKKLAGPSMSVRNLNTGSQIIKGSKTFTAQFDLSGPASTAILGYTDKPIIVTGIEVLYPNGTSSDTGVSLTVGYTGNTSGLLNITSATGQGANSRTAIGRTTGAAPVLYGGAIPAGLTLLASCAGGKVGSDLVAIIVHAVEIE